MGYDPILERRNQKYTREELDSFFKGSGRIQQHVRETNPTLYQEYRDAYEQAGGIGKSRQPNPVPYVKDYKPAPKQYSNDELAARGRHSEEATRAYFANSKKANEDFHVNRNLYEQMRESAVAFGMFEPHVIPYVPTKAAEPEWSMRISDELAKESNLPIGTVVNSEQLTQLCQQKVDRARQAQEAADAKIAADRAAELEKLTAAQRADQLERDRKQRDLDRIAELVVPKQITTPEPLELATARLVAQEKKAA